MPRQAKPWTVLVYLCGDNPQQGLDRDIRADLAEVLAAGGADGVHVAVQYDGPQGGGRWVVTAPWTDPATLPPPDVDLGRYVDSGSATTLGDFLKWGLATCPAEHVALVIAGTGILDERSVVGIPLQEPDRIFAICDDRPERSAIEIRDVGRVLQTFRERRTATRPGVDLLAFDMCHMQFLEVACELSGLVEILIGPQTEVPGKGWDFKAVLQLWHRLLTPLPPGVGARRTALRHIAAETVAEIGRTYASVPGHAPTAVSALDLAQLNPFLGAFDTMSLAYLQCLSDRILWSGRSEGLSRMGTLRDDASYDAREILRQVAGALVTRDVDCKVLAYGFDILRELDPRALLRVLGALESLVADVLAGSSPRLTEEGVAVLQAHERLHAWLLESAAALRAVAAKQDAGELAGAAFRRAWTAVLDARADALAQVAGFSSASALAPPAPLPGPPGGEPPVMPDGAQRLAGAALDEPFLGAWIALLDRYHRTSEPDSASAAFAALLVERRNALRIHDLVQRVADLLERPGSGSDGLVVSVAPPGTRYGGMSLYRPARLGELTRESYLALQVNQRLHWTAMLTAIHLIEDQPRQLWRVLSSLIATARQRGRQDLLARMAGPQALVSVGDQFRALTPAPVVTLAFEIESGERGARARRATDRVTAAEEDVYVARLSSSQRDAVIHEQRSRLDRAVVAHVVDELEAAASSGSIEPVARQLDKLGHILREDIVRGLTEPLEAERAAARETLHVQLQLPRTLLHYPWELVRDGDEWLGTRYALARQVFLDVAVTARRRPLNRPDRQRLRVLVVGDPLIDEGRPPAPPLAFARSEAAAVQEILQALARETDYLEVDPDAIRAGERVTVADMREWLRSGRFDVIHFCGHAHFNPAEPERSYWLLSDGPLAAEQIANTLDHCESPPWLVYVNACEGGMERGQGEGFLQSVTGLASAFLNRGVTAYLAPLWKIDDAAAMALAQAFYRSLVLDRATVGEALRLARREVREAHPGSPTWAGMTLYGDSTATVMQRVGALLSES